MKPRFGLVMIAKNEAAGLAENLATVRPYIGHWTLLDTGSTDGTQRIARAALKGIPGRVYQEPFVNFGVSRSRAFELARGTADFLIAADADMSWSIDPDFEPDPTVDAYLLEMGDAGMSWRLPLLLRGDLPWESRGSVHEYTVLKDGTIGNRQPTDKVRVHFPTTPSSPSKRHWHAGMLEEELERDPGNVRSTFYLAQTYRELGDPRAREVYLRRAAMGGFEEEAFYAQFRAALLTEWPGQAAELMAAWDRRPTRLEPLYYLVKGLNERGSHQAAYRLAMVPIVPSGDVLFVEPGVWDWGLMFERSIAAWWVGYRDEARLLGEELLRRDLPDHIRAAIISNLAFTQETAA